MKKNRKGFTLIELLVVIAIIGLLSTLAIVSLNSARQKSRDTKREADIRTIQSAVELCTNEAGSPPAVAASWAGMLAQPCGSTTLGSFLSSSSMPMPPQTTCDADGAGGAIPTGDCYVYCVNGNNYLLAANNIEASSAISGDLDATVGYTTAQCMTSAGAPGADIVAGYCGDGTPSVFCLGK